MVDYVIRRKGKESNVFDRKVKCEGGTIVSER